LWQSFGPPGKRFNQPPQRHELANGRKDPKDRKPELELNRTYSPAALSTTARAALKTLRAAAASLPPDRLKKVESAEQVLGTRTPDIRAVASELFSKIRNSPAADVVLLAKALLAMKTFETRQVAYEIIGRHRPAVQSLALDDVVSLGHGIDNWTAVDVFAGQVAGAAWREGRIADADVGRWARFGDRWWRRCAAVCTVTLNQSARGGKGDARRTLKICRLLVKDRDDMVGKALSWALRELIPHAASAVQEFVNKHEKALQGRVVREVRAKLTIGLKNPRRG
jgi:3-methyladenine DNA glycosylase AlkD